MPKPLLGPFMLFLRRCYDKGLVSHVGLVWQRLLGFIQVKARAREFHDLRCGEDVKPHPPSN